MANKLCCAIINYDFLLDQIAARFAATICPISMHIHMYVISYVLYMYVCFWFMCVYFFCISVAKFTCQCQAGIQADLFYLCCEKNTHTIYSEYIWHILYIFVAASTCHKTRRHAATKIHIALRLTQ